jgi:hypothetical protein
MICRNCGTEIADKAIVCYRCGTGTAEPVRKPAEIRRRRSPVVVILVLLALAVIGFLLGRHYHAFGLELAGAGYSLHAAAPPDRVDCPDREPILIDFLAIHA